MSGGQVPLARLAGAALLTLFAAILAAAAVVLGLTALYLWLRDPLGVARAVLTTGAVVLLGAGLLLALARRLQQRVRIPGAAEIGSDFVRRYPIESAVAALAAGLAVGGSEEIRRSLITTLSPSLDRGGR